jgi:hypothetical protein
MWIATKCAMREGDIERVAKSMKPDQVSEETEEESSESNLTAKSNKDSKNDDKSQETKAELLPPTLEPSSSLALPTRFKPIPIPDAPAITQTLQLARALRPFARLVEVGMTGDIDEAATVEQIAVTGVWNLVLKPVYELWLDVALVFDASPSMAIWQKVDKELQRLLSMSIATIFVSN